VNKYRIPKICKACNSRFCGGDEYSRYKECPCSDCIVITTCEEECKEFGIFSKSGMWKLRDLPIGELK
jgi:hypothetical protein